MNQGPMTGLRRERAAGSPRVLLWFVMLLTSALVACATPPPPVDARILADDLFAQPLPQVDPAEGIATNDAMRRFLHELAPQIKRHGAQAALGMVMQRPGWIDVAYDDSRTRTAAQTFDARVGNCLSLVMLTAALARELGLEVYFQEVLAAEQWSRRAGLHVVSGHVNVTLQKSKAVRYSTAWDSTATLTIDFLPPADAARQRTRTINLERLLAMFANNRAVEAMTDGDLRLAYAWARAALLQDPGFLHAANTLAVIYHRSGHHPAAERALNDVLAREPDNTRALGNLVPVLRALGREGDAVAAAQRLEAIEPERPFMFFTLGQQALADGQFAAARALFQKEVRRDPDYHETHFWLALVETRLGDLAQAQRHLERAAELSPEIGVRSRYAAKLEKLKAATRVQ